MAAVEGNREWRIAAALIALATVPLLAGGVRLGELIQGAEVTAENARFFSAPVPVILHILSVTAYSLLGAFQFLPSLRRSHPSWHRRCGRILVFGGLLVALSGLWLTQFYPAAPNGSTLLYLTRLAVGIAMLLFIFLAIASILRRNFVRHGAYMIRAYALALGAGTQVFTGATLLLIPGESGKLAIALSMAMGWIINILVAEWIIHRYLSPSRFIHRGGLSGDKILPMAR